MTTLGDYLVKIWHNYIAPSKEEQKLREFGAVYPENMDSSFYSKDGWGTDELSLEKLREVALQTPLLMKGIRKKSLDSTRSWFSIVTDDGTRVPNIDLRIVKDFEKRSRIKYKWYEAVVASFIYGDGYLMILYANDKNPIDEPPSAGAKPYTVEVLNSEKIREIKYHPKKSKFKKQHILHFHYEDFNSGKDLWIHPDRIIHITHNKLPHKIFGNSIVNLLRNIIKSKINVDIATGEILSWFAHGVFDITQEGMTPEERQEWERIAKNHPGYWIHDETAKITAVSPEAINPKAFYDYLVMQIAAALVMPKHVLEGINVGRVTGAEVGFADYYKDIRDMQDLIYTPLIEWLYSKLLTSYGRRWKYNIQWNAFYVGELAEADILERRVKSAVDAYQAGIITLEEARRIINEGQVMLDASIKNKEE